MCIANVGPFWVTSAYSGPKSVLDFMMLPLNTSKYWDAILKELQADIICFQEIKSSRAAIGRDIALPDSFHSFFSFPASKGGYRGVAVYADTRTESQRRPDVRRPATEDSFKSVGAHLDVIPPCARTRPANEQTPNDLLTLDLEGRALVLDFGLFVLINLYCPNEGSDARFSYNMNYHLMLQERVRGLIAAGREVVAIGDSNVCAAPIDHCDEHLPSNASTFWEHPARAWIRDWLEPRGPLIDVLRRFWPDRKGMSTYTSHISTCCWNTKVSAREANYDTRIDYVLVTPGLMPWIKAADIQPSIKGSDQLLPSRLTLAVKYWPEFQGKQLLMSNFFTKRGAEALPSQAPTAPPNGISPLTIGFDALNAQPQPVSEEQQSAPNAPPQVSSSGQPDIEPSSQSSMSPSSTQTSLKP
ncbi:Endonuclease/exonuclease/phosphatase [Russula emetica]|nr:Endonuclease/exonuclease/phosphatase [Russula emetica]